MVNKNGTKFYLLLYTCSKITLKTKGEIMKQLLFIIALATSCTSVFTSETEESGQTDNTTTLQNSVVEQALEELRSFVEKSKIPQHADDYRDCNIEKKISSFLNFQTSIESFKKSDESAEKEMIKLIRTAYEQGSINFYKSGEISFTKKAEKLTIPTKTGPLHNICRHGTINCLRALLIAGAKDSINFQDGKLEAPLHIACYTTLANPKMAPMIPILLKNGAKLNIANKEGETPFTAFQRGKRIRERGPNSSHNIKTLQDILKSMKPKKKTKKAKNKPTSSNGWGSLVLGQITGAITSAAKYAIGQK